MTDLRAWQHALLLNPTVTALLGNGAASVFQMSSFTDVPEDKPFLVHRLGLNIPELTDNNRAVAMSSPSAVWIHDLPGDYGRIDLIAEEIKNVFQNAAPGKVIQATWMSLGEELRDPEMGTILRVATFRLAYTP